MVAAGCQFRLESRSASALESSVPEPGEDGASQPSSPLARSFNSSQLWNSQYLTRIDLVRMRQHRLVGFEDGVVLVRIAIMFLGNGRQRVALLHRVERRLLARGRFDVVLDLGDSRNVAESEDDLLLDLLARRFAGHRHLVAVDLDVEPLDR